MKLITKCSRCKYETKISSNASTRTDLEMELGDTFLHTCSNCGTKAELTVKDVKAKENYTIILIGIVTNTVFAWLAWNHLGVFALITFSVPLILWRQQMSSIKAFNNYRRRNF